MDLGFIDKVLKPPSLTSQAHQGVKLEEDEQGQATSPGEKHEVKVLKEGSDFCLSFIELGAFFCLCKNCVTNNASSVGVGGQSSFVPSPGGVLAILKNPDVAFSLPTLKLSSVEEEVMPSSKPPWTSSCHLSFTSLPVRAWSFVVACFVARVMLMSLTNVPLSTTSNPSPVLPSTSAPWPVSAL